MRRTSRVACTLFVFFLVGIIPGSRSWAQSPADSRKESPPDFDIRDLPVSTGKAADERIVSEAIVEGRQASIASFAASPQEVQLGTRIVVNRYGLPKLFLRDGSALTAQSPLKPAEIAKSFLLSRSEIFSMTPDDVNSLRLLVEDVSGSASFLAFNQTFDGIDVFNGQIKFTLGRNGEVIQVGTGDVVPGLSLRTTPRISPEEAVQDAFVAIGSARQSALSRIPGTTAKAAFINPRGGNYSQITAELSIFPMTASSARLAYRISLEVDSQSWFEILIDADSGDMLFRHNLYAFSSQARVWTQSPLVESRTLVTFPEPSTVNPSGWLPQNGTVTTGNSVDAFVDTNGDGRPDDTADPNMRNGRAYSASQLFDFPFGDGTTQQNPRSFQPASVTNLFYLVNVAHDYYYSLGFTEASGNFQTDNFGRGGTANDAVIAEAQFGGFTDNASFSTPPDGTAPRVLMGVFTRGTTSLTDDVDSDYDGQVLIHEYGHGVSNRLVGARTSTTCLIRIQSAAMGEGWSDYFGTSFYNNPVNGAYVSQNSTRGARRQSYEGYTFTYEDIGNAGYEVHADGEIWAATLWDLRKSLGGPVTDRLVIDGLKSTPCSPSMTDARDAILSADQAVNSGANRTAIWTVFARHGMGYSALGADGDTLTGTRYDAAYNLPPSLQGPANPAITSNPLLLHYGAGDLYKYNLAATNPAGGVLNYALAAGPAGMLVDPASGLASWNAAFVGARIKINVTDGQGGKVVHGYLLPLQTALNNGTPLTINGDRGSVGYATITIPANTPVLQVTLRGGSGDPYLSVRGADGSVYASFRPGTVETLSFANPRAGQWQIAVVGSLAYSGVSLNAGILTPTPLSSNATVSGLADGTSGETFYRVAIPAGVSALSVTTSGGTGDVDIFLRRGLPAVCQSSSSVSTPCFLDYASDHDGNAESINVNSPGTGDWYLDLLAYGAYSGVRLEIATTFPAITLPLTSGGSATASTLGTASTVTAGYAIGTVTSGAAPFATAVFSYTQNGNIVSEAGIPASPLTQSARIFIDYRTGVATSTGKLDIFTGFAITRRGTGDASVTYTLRDRSGQTIATGHGTLAQGAHEAKFLHELKNIAPDFNLPANFPTATLFGSLEIMTSLPASILALRLTTNQRGDVLMTSTPVADMSTPVSPVAPAAVYFPQLADGGGYVTAVTLLNTSNATQAGTIALFDNDGAAFNARSTDGTSGATFPYSIPAAGAFVFRTDGSPASPRTGWIKVTANSGNTLPVGAGIFSYSPAGILITESGIPSAAPTTRARVYVDKSNGHDTGIAVANPGGSAGAVNLRAFQTDGTTAAGNGQTTLNLAANGHSSAFVGQLVSGLPAGFTGVAELTSTTPFVALTLRSLMNARGDFLLTTFPIADANQTAPSPIVFPHIASGGGYATQFIFISAGGAASVNLNASGDGGSPVSIAPNR